MKNFAKMIGIGALALIIGLFLTSCDEGNPEDFNLAVPENVKITVEGRLMTVTWDAVANAQGYEITTTSADCASGNRLIDTKAGTAKNLEGAGNFLPGADIINATTGEVTGTRNKTTNGTVEIKPGTKIEISLMPESGTGPFPTLAEGKPMATAVTAKVKALGGKVGGDEYLDSGYSSVKTKSLSE
ncbi:MAG: hypothetical protein LBH44_02865 [Treponema sp.]|jgi:hypothetical protein|nr:hypothetical protein [Treponema sp.]